MTDIYTQHRAAFVKVAAYVILRDGKRVATVAFKFAASGLRTTCFFHVLGTEMTKGVANGGGYDKASASAEAAVRASSKTPGTGNVPAALELLRIRSTLEKDSGHSWNRRLEDAGYTVLQAV